MEKNTGSSKLVENIRAAMSPSEISSSNKGQYGIASLAADMSKSLGNNTEVIQTIINEQGDATRDEFIKLVKLMTSSQNKKGEELQKAVGEIIKQVAKLKLSAGDRGEELEKNLGLNRADKTLNKGSWLKEKFNVDQNKTGLGAIKQAFTMDSMFGTMFNKNKKSILEKRAGLESQQETQEKALDAVTSKKALNSGNKKNKKDKDGISVNSVEGDISVNSDKGGDNTTITKEESKGGIDAASELEKQTDKLNEILEELYSIEDAVRANSDSIVEDVAEIVLTGGAALTTVAAGGFIGRLAAAGPWATAVLGTLYGIYKLNEANPNTFEHLYGANMNNPTEEVDGEGNPISQEKLDSIIRPQGIEGKGIIRPQVIEGKVDRSMPAGWQNSASSGSTNTTGSINTPDLRGGGVDTPEDLARREAYANIDKRSTNNVNRLTGTVDRSDPVPVAIVSAVERGGVIPTASAIANMTERADGKTVSNSGQTIINNITNNTTNPTNTPILTTPISPRNRNLGPMWHT